MKHRSNEQVYKDILVCCVEKKIISEITRHAHLTFYAAREYADFLESKNLLSIAETPFFDTEVGEKIGRVGKNTQIRTYFHTLPRGHDFIQQYLKMEEFLK